MRLQDSLSRTGDNTEVNNLRLEIGALKAHLEEARRSRNVEIDALEQRMREKDQNLEVFKQSNQKSIMTQEERLQQVLGIFLNWQIFI